MKVIIIKKWKNYEVDQIVEVANGFGTNFLIKNGYALPLNKSTTNALETKLEAKKAEFIINKEKAKKLKEELEKLNLVFFLKVTNDVIHGTITTKKVNQALIEKGYKLEKHIIPHIAIASIGRTKIPVKLFDGVIAEINIEVRSE